MTDTPGPASRSAAERPLRLLRVAVPSPLRRAFDYLPSDTRGAVLPLPGMRVVVPFGRGERVAMVVAHADHTDVPRQRLKRVSRVLDGEPLLDAQSLAFLRWASDYFHHPIGDVVLGTLPAALRAGKPLPAAGESRWRLTESGLEKRLMNKKKPRDFKRVFEWGELDHVVPTKNGFKFYKPVGDSNPVRRFWNKHISDAFSGEFQVETEDRAVVLEILAGHGIPVSKP